MKRCTLTLRGSQSITSIAPTEALEEADAISATGHSGADFAGHPRGLTVIGSTKLLDGFSFYGLQALLTLYMAEALLTPGHVENIIGFAGFRHTIEAVTGPLGRDALAAQIFGLYVGTAYFLPVIGGWVADRWLGLRNTIALGGTLMTAGHFAMAFDASFLLALVLLMVGAGCMHGNMMSQVGRLYAAGDRRRADGFQIYYLAVNLSAFVAPIVIGGAAQGWGWHTGFVLAGVGMAAGVALYLAGSRHLPPDPPRQGPVAALPYTPDERRRIAMLIALVPLCALFWIAQSQVWNVYNLWVRDHVDLVIAGWTMPIPWLQAIDGLAPALLMPPFVALWRWQAARGREPDDFAKLSLGCLIFSAGMAWLAAAAPLFPGKVPVLWAVGFHLLSNLGWLYFTPISMALFARAAPPRAAGVMMGVAQFAIFIGSTVSGRLGALYSSWSATDFWLLHAAICAGGALAFALLARPLRHLLRAG